MLIFVTDLLLGPYSDPDPDWAKSLDSDPGLLEFICLWKQVREIKAPRSRNTINVLKSDPHTGNYCCKIRDILVRIRIPGSDSGFQDANKK
jgi:hypothetical protein